MPNTEHVQVQITVDSVGVTRQGFGGPLVLSHNADFPERVRVYSSAAAGADDFESDSPEQLALNAFFSQTPKPPRVYIGRATASVTQQYTVGVGAGGAFNEYDYAINVVGEGFESDEIEYTSDTAANAAEIHYNLLTGLNAVVDKTYTAAFAALVMADATFTADASDVITETAHGKQTGDGPFQLTTTLADLPLNLLTATDYWIIRIDANTYYLATSLANALAGTRVDIGDAGTGTHTISDTVNTKRPSSAFTVTGNTAGAWFSLEVNSAKALSISQTHTVSGLADDLDEILLENSEWYMLFTLYNSSDYVQDAAAWTAANGRTYVFATNDTDVITTAYDEMTSDDIGAELLAEGYSGVMGCYHPSPAEFLAEGWMGAWLPTDPGEATTKFITIEGTDTVALTDTHKTNLRARRMNTYERVYQTPITWEGTVFSTTYRFLDVRRDVDWLIDEVQKALFGLLAGSKKIPYTPAGLAKVEGTLRASVEGTAVDKGVLAEGTTVIEMPVFEDIDAADKSDRILRNAKFFGTLQGAVHAIIPVSGVVTF